MRLPKVIVGVDPGTTAAVAVLNLKGRLLATESRRNFGKNEIVKFISSMGTPTIIATDRALAPSIVMKISSSFNSVVFSPDEDMKNREKLDMTRGFKTDDVHQRDALAAALHAYRNHEELLKKIERTVEGLNLWKYVDDVKDMVLRGRCGSVAEAIDILLSAERKPEDKKISGKKEATKVDMENIVGKLRGSLREKERSFSIMEKYAGKLEERVKFLEEENEKLRKKAEVKREKGVPRKIENRIKNLKGEIGSGREKMRETEKIMRTLRELEKIRKEGLVPVKVIGDSSEEKLRETEKSLGLYRDVLYFRSYSKNGRKFIEKLKAGQTEMVIGDFPESVKEKMEKEGLVVMGKSEIDVKLGRNWGSISPESMKKAGKSSFIGWLKDYRKR